MPKIVHFVHHSKGSFYNTLQTFIVKESSGLDHETLDCCIGASIEVIQLQVLLPTWLYFFAQSVRKKVAKQPLQKIIFSYVPLCPIFWFQTRQRKSDRDYGPFPAILTFTIFASIILEWNIRILSFCLPSFLAETRVCLYHKPLLSTLCQQEEETNNILALHKKQSFQNIKEIRP